jgi:hypothetical protein
MFPQAQVTQVLNNAVKKINFLTGIVEELLPMVTQGNQLVYPMAAGMIFPLKLYVEGIELEKYSLNQLGTQFRNWATDTTASAGPMARWAPIGIDQFVIHPMDAVGGRLIEVNGVSTITPMVNPGDTVDLDDDQVPTLIDYCRGRIMMKLGGKPFASASVSYQRFINEIRDMVIWEGLVFPQYFVAKQLEVAEGKGA